MCHNRVFTRIHVTLLHIEISKKRLGDIINQIGSCIHDYFVYEQFHLIQSWMLAWRNVTER